MACSMRSLPATCPEPCTASPTCPMRGAIWVRWPSSSKLTVVAACWPRRLPTRPSPVGSLPSCAPPPRRVDLVLATVAHGSCWSSSPSTPRSGRTRPLLPPPIPQLPLPHPHPPPPRCRQHQRRPPDQAHPRIHVSREVTPPNPRSRAAGCRGRRASPRARGRGRRVRDRAIGACALVVRAPDPDRDPVALGRGRGPSAPGREAAHQGVPPLRAGRRAPDPRLPRGARVHARPHFTTARGTSRSCSPPCSAEPGRWSAWPPRWTSSRSPSRRPSRRPTTRRPPPSSSGRSRSPADSWSTRPEVR